MTKSIKKGAVKAYVGIENAVVGGYKAVETRTVESYKAVEDAFVGAYKAIETKAVNFGRSLVEEYDRQKK